LPRKEFELLSLLSTWDDVLELFNVSNDVYNTTNLTLLHIKLTDQDGALLDLNGCHFSLTLQIDIYK
jgi:hypothetical protein